MAAVEAMAAETPVLLSNEVGVAPAADQADAGISVPLDEDEITEALHQLLSDASVRERMAANGPNHVRSQYSPESVADQMVNEIQTLMRLHKE
jgi:glycosyltransferase involved in cell wall biosynthesis